MQNQRRASYILLYATGLAERGPIVLHNNSIPVRAEAKFLQQQKRNLGRPPVVALIPTACLHSRKTVTGPVQTST